MIESALGRFTIPYKRTQIDERGTGALLRSGFCIAIRCGLSRAERILPFERDVEEIPVCFWFQNLEDPQCQPVTIKFGLKIFV